MNGSGEMGAIKGDTPSLQVLRSPEDKHSDHDKPEWVPAVGLEAVARAYVRIIGEVNKMELKQPQPTGANPSPITAR